MSTLIGMVFSLPGLLVISVAVAIWIWRSADRDAANAVTGLSPPAGRAITEPGEHWVRRQLTRRTRWSIIAIEATICVLAVVVLAAPTDPLIDHVLGDERLFLIALIVGRTIGATLATVLSVRSDAGRERSATLRPRTVKAYVRPWESRLRLAHLIAAPTTIIVAACLWASGALTGASVFYVGLSLTWLAGVAISELLRNVLPVDLGSTLLGLSCSYIMWTIVARAEMRLGGIPGPEWHFARTTGSVA